MTTFLLIRHATYDAIGHTLTGRTPGLHLDGAGLAQAYELAERLGNLRIDAVVSSPLERARETAAPLAERIGVDITVEADLAEVDFGAWSGRTFAELAPEPDWQRWNSFRSGTGTPGGETMLGAQARFVQALQRWRERAPDATIALVSHCDVIRAGLAYFLGIPLDLFLRLEISPASVSILKLEPYGPQVTLLNHTGALPDL